MIGLVWVHETPCPSCGERLDYWVISKQFGEYGRLYAMSWVGGFRCHHCDANLYVDYTPLTIPIALNVLFGGVIIIGLVSGLLPWGLGLGGYAVGMIAAFLIGGFFVRIRPAPR